MITERDLEEAIAECVGERNPDAQTCMKLAAYYIIRDELRKSPTRMDETQPSYGSGSEFEELASRVDRQTLVSVMDDLMSTLSVLNPRAYNSVMRKLERGG